LGLLFLPFQNIQAQCGITPDPAASTTGTIDIDISTSGTTVSLDAAVLSAKGIAPVNGPGGAPACNLYLYPSHEDGTTPALAFTSFGLVNQPGFPAGSYHFNINGQAFKTEVAAGGWILIAASKSDAAAAALTTSTDLTFQSNEILPPAVYTANLNNNIITDIRITASSGPNSPFEAFTNNITELTNLSNGRTLSANTGTGNNWTGPSAAFMNKTCASNNEPLADKIYHACGNANGMHWFPIDGMIKTQFNESLENDLNLWVKGNTTLLSLPLNITCGTANPNPSVGTTPTYPTSIYQVVADDDGILDNTNTSASIEINVTITDTGDPTFTAGTCTAPPGGPFSTNEDGDPLSMDDCQTTIPGLSHPGIMDNCSGAILSVVYTNNGNSTASAIVPAGDLNSYKFSSGTTTVTYTITDGNTNTAMCNFDVIVEDDEDPSFLDPSVAIGNLLQDEVHVKYINPNSSHSGRVNIVLNCNSGKYQDDLEAAMAFLPITEDNCNQTPIVTPIDTTITSLTCANHDTLTNMIEHIIINYQVSDTLGNILSTPSEEFKVYIFTQDTLPPDFNPTSSLASIPSPIIMENESTDGTSTNPYIYVGDTIRFGTNLTPNNLACELDFSGLGPAPDTSMLAVFPDDCQSLTFTSMVQDTNGLIIFSGTTNDIIHDTIVSMEIFAVGTYTITYTATDPCSHVSRYLFTLVVEDNTAPVLDVAATVNSIASSYSSDPGGCEATIQFIAPTISDNCATPGTGLKLSAEVLIGLNASILTVDLNAGGTPLMHSVELPVGTWGIRYTLTDGISTSIVDSIQIVVEDLQPPSLSCGIDQKINSICPGTSIPDFRGNSTLFDQCGPGGIEITQSPPTSDSLGSVAANDPNFSLADGESFTVTLTATDTINNASDFCTFVVMILDRDAPTPDTIPLPTINANTTLNTECGLFELTPPTASNCDGTSIQGTTTDADSFTDLNNDGIPDIYFFSTGSTFVEWTYRDDNNNESTQTQIITIADDMTPPAISITESPLTIPTTSTQCFANINLDGFLTRAPSTVPFSTNQLSNRQYIDNCSGPVTIAYEVSGATEIPRTITSSSIPPVLRQLNKGSNIITFYATDAAGREGSAIQQINVQDNTPPDASASLNNIILSIGDMNDVNSNDCAYTIANGALVDPTATDNCANPPLRTLLDVSANTTIDGGTFSDPTTFMAGTLEGYTFNVANGTSAVFTATYLFNDGNGQSITKSVTITVVDDRQPDITCPTNTNTTRDADGSCGYSVIGSEFDLTSVGDNCTNSSQLSITNNYNSSASLAGASFPVGTTNVRWTVTDSNNKTTTCDIIVTIEDNVEPVLNCVDINRNLPAAGTVTVDAFDFLSLANISDACDDGTDPLYYTISIDRTTFDCSDATNQPIPVEITVTDPSGNIAICRPTIKIQETVAPTANCLAAISRDLSATAPGMVTVNASELNNGSTDNCTVNTSGLIFSFTPNATNPMTSMDFGCGDIGANTVNFYAIDASGNVSAPCTATITITDATSIAIQCQDITRTLNANGSITVNASEFNSGSTDNCGATSALTYNLRGVGPSAALGCTNIGDNNFILDIFDGTNTSSCNVVLTIVDQTGPVADCQPVTVDLTGTGTRTINAAMFNNNSMDVCSGNALSFEFNDGSTTRIVDCNDLGTNPVTITVKDLLGNATICNTFLTVQPESPAVFTAASVSGGTGATVDINITADDYYEMVSWQFSGDIDPAFATINSITTSFAGIFTPQFDAITGEFQMGYSQFPSATLADGIVVATINVTLVSNIVGSTTAVNLKDGALALEIAQGCSVAPQATDIDEATHLVDGSLTIANGQVTIAGIIQNDQGLGIPNVDIAVTGGVTLSATTDATGAYSVVVPGGSTVTVTPTKDVKHKNGISALDAALVQALANNSTSATLLPTPTRRIAADANTDQSISVGDAGIISFVNVISGATFHNPPGYDVNSWVFVDANHVFTNPLNPWSNPYNDALTYTNVTTSQTGQNFTGIKIGDVTGDADVTMLANHGDTRSDNLKFTMMDQAVAAGETIEIPLKAISFQDLIALQTTLNFNASALTFNGILTDQLDQSGNTVMDLSQAESGLLALSWYSGQSVTLADQEIAVVLNFTANQALETLEGHLFVSDELITAGAWHSDQEAIGVDLEIEVLTTINQPVTGFKLFQNKPNPFRSSTLIAFNLPEETYGTLSIYDISGRLVYQVSENYGAGYHEVAIDRSQLNKNGVFIYQFKTDKYAATKKLTLLD